MAFQKALFCKLHGKRQPRLSAQSGQKTVRLFFFNDPLYSIERQRFNIDFISHSAVGHNGRRVGVYQHNLKTLFLKCAAGLCACIVKFNGLADYNRTGTDNQYLFYIFIQRHNDTPSINLNRSKRADQRR